MIDDSFYPKETILNFCQISITSSAVLYNEGKRSGTMFIRMPSPYDI